MAHELAGALQQAGRIAERCAVKETHVYVRSEDIDVAEGRISQTGNRTAVMQELPDFVPAFSHHPKSAMRDGSQFTSMLSHPSIDGGSPLDSAAQSQQFRSHRRDFGFSRGCSLMAFSEEPAGSRVQHFPHTPWDRRNLRFGRRVGEERPRPSIDDAR